LEQSKTIKNGVKVTDSFWRKRMEIVRDEVIPYQWGALNDLVPDAPKSHAIENFRIAAGEKEGDFEGMVFQDSDLMKWLEAVAYSLETDPDPELEKKADDVIDLLEKAQQEDGYLDTYFILKEPDKKWANLRDWHELYCAGHMIEAAVAYYEVTGKDKFLNIVCRFADLIDSIFGEGKILGYPGHQEIELALLKLYRVTQNERYLKLSYYFIDQRGKQPHYFDSEKEKRGETADFWWNNDYAYQQADLPVREQTHAAGHAVRAMYMYTAMADLAAETNDESLKRASEILWENVTQTQMYITGGIGSAEFGEAFSIDYDLPNDTCYTETCASIGLVFWANRMLNLEKNGIYTDVMERALYNGTISGMDLDGKKFFYVNPLEVHPEVSRHRGDHKHVKPVRQKWYACACCPPNLARMIASIGRYIYSVEEQTAYVHLFVGSETELKMGNHKVVLSQQTTYPWNGQTQITVLPEQSSTFTLSVRIPGWCKKASLSVNGEPMDLTNSIKKGYAYITRLWKKDDQVELNFDMPIEKVRSHPKVKENLGKVALQRGPVVYCLEEVDNGPDLSSLSLSSESELEASYESNLLDGIVTISGTANRIEASESHALYTTNTYSIKTTPFKAIPYYAWCNREPGEMIVWVREEN
jgi:uncharacterized protein